MRKPYILKRKRRNIYIMVFLAIVLIKCCEYFVTTFTEELDSSDIDEQTHGYTDRLNLVLINAYMRSGSSFLGMVLGYRQDSFYIYEPLRKSFKYKYIKGDTLCNTKHPYCVNSPTARTSSLQNVLNLFNCDFSKDQEQFTELLSYKSGPKWRIFIDCKHKLGLTADECIKRMENICLEQSNRVIKVLRLSLEDASHILTTNNDIKVIQIFRDPRAVLNSAIHTFWYPLNITDKYNLENNAEVLCSRMEEDLTAGQRLMKLYPNNVRLVNYEDITLHSGKAEILYNFTGMTFSGKDKRFLKRFYHKEREELSSGQHFNHLAFQYRKKLPYELVSIIQTHCSRVIHKLGLKLFLTENQLHDENFSPVINRLPFRL